MNAKPAILSESHIPLRPVRTDEIALGSTTVNVAVHEQGGTRTFDFTAGGLSRKIAEQSHWPLLDSGSALLDGLFALSLQEVAENSVSGIHAHAFKHGQTTPIEAFETGELWQYVWTRDLAYAVDLGLGGLDVKRCMTSLLYKTSGLKPSLGRDAGEQILEDTGSGGSYPVSTDRVVWVLGARRVAMHLNEPEQEQWIRRVLPIMTATIEQDRKLIFDERTGLYRGEQSFLDWREQTYPLRTRDNVLLIATSLSTSTNVLHYAILRVASRWLKRFGDHATADRYLAWAEALKAAINDKLFDEEAGLYSGYMLYELSAPLRVGRYDLLGQCLAILAGVADTEKAHRILSHYPTGPHGPSVVWPQESLVPIYHNHAIWPFVTAYWIKAARFAGHELAVAHGIASLINATAINLSNMENLDWYSGHAHGEAHGISGPVINSRRQLWSVAGFTAAVIDVLFGMETSDEAVRFAPCVPRGTWETVLKGAPLLRLQNIDYRGKRIDVTMEMPAKPDWSRLTVGTVLLNGREIGGGFVPHHQLAEKNEWHIRMVALDQPRPEQLKLFTDLDNPRAVFGPSTPAWRPVGQHGITAENGRLKLHYEAIGDPNVVFNIYRDGKRVARNLTATEWTDPESPDYADCVRQYAIEAVFPETGNRSYPSETRVYDAGRYSETLVSNGGIATHDLTASFPFRLVGDGRHLLRVGYSNHNGTINTGITCAVKCARIADGEGNIIASGYLILPQTGGEQMIHPSSTIEFSAPAAGDYVLLIGEDDYSINMSYFAHNVAYTGHEGGGEKACNEIRVLSVQTLRLSNGEASSC